MGNEGEDLLFCAKTEDSWVSGTCFWGTHDVRTSPSSASWSGRTKEQCEALCLNMPTCTGAVWNSKEWECMLRGGVQKASPCQSHEFGYFRDNRSCGDGPGDTTHNECAAELCNDCRNGRGILEFNNDTSQTQCVHTDLYYDRNHCQSWSWNASDPEAQQKCRCCKGPSARLTHCSSCMDGLGSIVCHAF